MGTYGSQQNRNRGTCCCWCCCAVIVIAVTTTIVIHLIYDQKHPPIYFGDPCTNTTSLPDGFCCCSASGLTAYGSRSKDKPWCSLSLACQGSHKGYCAGTTRKGAEPIWKQASRDFCQFDCPCCNDVDYRKALHNFSTPAKSSSSLYSKWEGDPLELFAVPDGHFHRDIMSKVKANHTLAEFYKKTFKEPSWASIEKLHETKNWNDGELAMHLYTTEYPELYRRLNKMIREATSMSDINPYWQSYMAILKKGLEKNAIYNDATVYRGTTCDANQMTIGSSNVFPAFTSTSSAEHVAKVFGCATLEITGGAYVIEEYARVVGNAEMIIEPGRIYTVVGKSTDKESKRQTIKLSTKGPHSMTEPHNVVMEERGGVGDWMSDSCRSFDRSMCPICMCCQKPPVDTEPKGAKLFMEDLKKERFNVRSSSWGSVQALLKPG